VRASAHFFRRYRVPLSYIVIHDFLHVDVRNLISIVTARPSYNHCPVVRWRSRCRLQLKPLTKSYLQRLLGPELGEYSPSTYPHIRTHTYVLTPTYPQSSSSQPQDPSPPSHADTKCGRNQSGPEFQFILRLEFPVSLGDAPINFPVGAMLRERCRQARLALKGAGIAQLRTRQQDCRSRSCFRP
jgi:hypothetical protein